MGVVGHSFIIAFGMVMAERYESLLDEKEMMAVERLGAWLGTSGEFIRESNHSVERVHECS